MKQRPTRAPGRRRVALVALATVALAAAVLLVLARGSEPAAPPEPAAVTLDSSAPAEDASSPTVDAREPRDPATARSRPASEQPAVAERLVSTPSVLPSAEDIEGIEGIEGIEDIDDAAGEAQPASSAADGAESAQPAPAVGQPAPPAATATPAVRQPAPRPPSTAQSAVQSVVQEMRFRIPSLGVDAPLVALSVDADGQMEAPSDGQTVAWYRFTAKPGSPGNAVFSGHVDYRKSTAVFWRLRELKDGDRVIIATPDGDLVYVVDDAQMVEPEKADVGSIIGGRSGPQTITLITCGGIFDRSVGAYDRRLIVRAVRLDEDGAEARSR